MLVGSSVFLVILLKPSALAGQFFFPILITFGLVAPIGALWAVYQAIRHEKDHLKCIAIILLIPFGFLWYYFERYRTRIAGVVPSAQ
jgi:hypothetical protein